MAENEEQVAAEEIAEPKRKTPMMAIAVAAGGILGVTVATYVIAPKLVVANAPPAEAAQQQDDGGGHDGEEASGGHGASGGEAGRMLEFGNILVNPAGSQGLRFLMVSIALEVPTNQLREQLNQREPQIRDLVITVLERQTMESLMKTGAREAVRAQVVDALKPLMGGSSYSVYLPQFVIN